MSTNVFGEILASVVDDTLDTRVVYVTPQLAAKWLRRNVVFRSINDKHVRALVWAIRNGAWRLTHQGIAFDKDGHLIDGQHRLTAVVKANIAVPMCVTAGVERSTHVVFDTGKR